jgi:hypothetical protein
MIKLFFLIFTYMLMIVQLISVLSLDFSELTSCCQSYLVVNLSILLLLMVIVYLLSKKLIREMLTEK